jgi:hypothetical protein
MSNEYRLDKLDNETRLDLIAKHDAAKARRIDDERLLTASPENMANGGWPAHLKPHDDEFSDEEYAILTSRDTERSAIIRSHSRAAEKRAKDEAYLRSLPIPKLGASESLPLYPGELDPLALRDVWQEVGKVAAAEKDAQWGDSVSRDFDDSEGYVWKRDENGNQVRRPVATSRRLKELKAKLRETPMPRGDAATETWVSTID